MSVIETPPEDRLPIQTRVAEASAGLVRDAILRELDRGGQVFFVHNRVETIEAQAEQLRRLLPGVRIVVGHGQMPEGALEKVMLTFAGGEADVLVCTTIIESGLDIPNANTIVIDRADTLGLAQLYQLRGRVGRSSAPRLRLPPLPAPRADERGGAEAAPGDLQRVGAGRRVPDRARGPRDPRRGQHPRRGAVRAHGGGRVRPLLAAAGRGGRGAEGAARGPRAGASSRRRPSSTCRSRRTSPTTTSRRRPRSSSCTGGWPGPATRGDLAAFRQEVTDRFGPMPRAGPAPGRGRRAAAAGRGRGRRVASSREEGRLVVRFGDGLSRATAMRLLAGGGAARRPARRHDVRQQPGPDPPAARPARGLGADPGVVVSRLVAASGVAAGDVR